MCVAPSHHSTVVLHIKWCYTLICGFSGCPCIFFAGLFNLSLQDGATGENNGFLRSHNLFNSAFFTPLLFLTSFIMPPLSLFACLGRSVGVRPSLPLIFLPLPRA